MKRSLLILTGLGALVVIAAALWHYVRSDSDEDQRYNDGLTEVIASNLSGASVTLYKAGSRLSDTVRLSDRLTHGLWLGPGNYFLRSDDAGKISYVPIPLTGYRCGPDKEGSFLVTLRPLPASVPPWPSANADEFAYIPSGNMLMGDRHNPSERHYVWLTGYFVERFEVTNREYREFLDAKDGYADDANWTKEGVKWKEATASEASALLVASSAEFRRFGQPDQPVTMVTWYEANAFCRWLTRRFELRKWQFALPSDAEWEKAARGPDNFDYALSMSISDAEAPLYNWRKNPEAPVPVFGTGASAGMTRQNRYGIYHMTGNVAEWTQSINRPFSREHPYLDDDRNHDDAEGLRTVRGGSWYSAAISYMYIPYRDSFQPEHRTQDIGFRVVARILP
jgi:formylglycine-generating enzyme required for sulfatase activity